MCLAVPGRVKKIEGRKAFIKYTNEERMALIGGDNVRVGDYVMVQMGIIVKILTPKEAKESITAWRQSEN